ncbi:MAG: SH3 domain-containing protein [Chloroflexi bacterium]|nr:SH3 domain-containing protein [Chloroflexota bacterium]
MQRWTAILLSGALVVAFIIGLFVHPLDSQANPDTGWFGTFYDNPSLTGSPVLSRNEREINFNWSMDPPAAEVPSDGFSARWTGAFHFEEGNWQFTVGVDDGVRLWVNDTLLIDQWAPSGRYIVFSEPISLERGTHEVKIEYYDAQGLAGINVNWQPIPGEGAAPSNSVNDAPQAPAPQTDPTPGPQKSGLVANVATGVLNVRTGPAIQYDRIDQIFLYQRYAIISQNQAGTWYQIDLRDGRLGWVSARYVLVTGEGEIPVQNVNVPEPPGEFPGAVGISLDRLNIRPTPDTSQEPLAVIPFGQEFAVLGRNSTSIWYRVQYEAEIVIEPAEDAPEDAEPQIETRLIDGWVFAPFVRLQNTPVYDLPFIE